MPISFPQLLQLGLLQPSGSMLLYPPGLSGDLSAGERYSAFDLWRNTRRKEPADQRRRLGRGSVAWRGYSIGMPQQGQANASISSPSFARRT